MSERKFPRHYLGATVGNGYIIPSDPGEFEETVFLRLLKAADEEADTTAQAIINSLPISHYEAGYTRTKYGISARWSKNTVTLAHAHFPPSFKGKCMPELQRLAKDGHFTAARLVSEITRERMLDPEFVIYDTGR